jgi:putative peptidoglycan lipid II flippase
MNLKQLKNSFTIIAGQLLIKGSGFIQQLLMAFYLGISADIDLLIVAQIVPTIIGAMIAGGAGEILVTSQKKGKKYDEHFLALYIFTIAFITALIGLAYYLSLPLFNKLFSISEIQFEKFYWLSFIITLSKIPAALVSTLQPLLYAKSKYNYFVVSSLISQVIGIIVILLLFKTFGIIAFAVGMLTTQTVNSILFINVHRIKIAAIFYKSQWIDHKTDLIEILKKTLSLSLQTLLNYLSTFWERTLSMKFLKPGFLSALNYSKTLTELPKMVLLSSILTTTYIEQVNQKHQSETDYERYTKRMETILSNLAALFQFLSYVYAPIIIILMFKRGKFDTDAVIYTMSIYQVLIFGFAPGLMMNFFTRTMYIEGMLKNLFWTIFVKVILEIAIMSALITYTPLSIPIAIVAGRYFISFSLFYLLYHNRKSMFNVKNLITINLLLLISSIILFYLNIVITPLIVHASIGKIILYYIPITLILSILGYYYVHKKQIFKSLKPLKK